MKYLIIALINLIYGILLFATLKSDTPGFYLIIFIAAVITILGLIGIALWFWKTFFTAESLDQTTALKNWFQVTKGVDILLVLGILFRSFILQPFLVEGNSMEPNFHNREFLLVDRVSYHLKTPQRGEVIIFEYPKNPSEDYIKRIVGLPGEQVKIEDGQIYINGLFLEENYLSRETKTYVSSGASPVFNTILGPEEYFVLGDNRDSSSDSRDWGPVPKENLIGRAWFTIYPTDNFGKIKNPIVQLLPMSKSLTSWSLT